MADERQAEEAGGRSEPVGADTVPTATPAPPPDTDALLRALIDFAHGLAGDHDVAHVISDLSARISALLGVDGVGVSLAHEGRLRFVAVNQGDLAELERVQEASQEGPCVDVVRSGRAVTVEDLGRDGSSWSAYTSRARSMGVRAVAGVPMRLHGSVVGVVDLYDRRPRRWSEGDLDTVRALSDFAAGYLALVSRMERERRTVDQLQAALDSRVVIEQAKGIIAAHRGVGIDEAFRVLRKHANDHHASIHTTAEAVVRLGLRP